MMYVVYSWENPNSLNKVYFSNDGLTLHIHQARIWNSIEEIYQSTEELIEITKHIQPCEWFIGELEPICKGFLGEF